MIVVDSSVWIAHMCNTATEAVLKLRSLDHPDEIIVGDLVLLEVLQGAIDDRDAMRIESHLRKFRIERMLDDELATKAARNYRALRGHGVTVRKTIDTIIATFCIEREHVLLHDDRDFDLMQVHLGLRTI